MLFFPSDLYEVVNERYHLLDVPFGSLILYNDVVVVSGIIR